MRLVNLLCTALALCFVGAGASANADLIQRLSSANLSDRQEASLELAPERVGDLDPELAVRAILIAARDIDPSIRGRAFGGIAGLMALRAAADRGASAGATAESIQHHSTDLRPLLEEAVTSDESPNVAFAASASYMLLYGSEPAAEAILLDRVDREQDVFDRLRLLSNLRIGGIDSAETFDHLARYLDREPMPIQIMAAHLLLLEPTLPPDRLDDFLRIIEVPEAFADPQLVNALPRFNVSPETYLPRLLALQSKLEGELRKPVDQRTLAIYNDDYWMQTLDAAIGAAQQLSTNTDP